MDNMQQAKETFIRTNRTNIGIDIKRIRTKKGFSQSHLADLMGISRATISKIENGKFAFSVDYLAKFAWHLSFDMVINEKEHS
jgi:transcriptional regulator with XRE-family HTH domain